LRTLTSRNSFFKSKFEGTALLPPSLPSPPIPLSPSVPSSCPSSPSLLSPPPPHSLRLFRYPTRGQPEFQPRSGPQTFSVHPLLPPRKFTPKFRNFSENKNRPHFRIGIFFPPGTHRRNSNRTRKI
jgi:hypothetical protein